MAVRRGMKPAGRSGAASRDLVRRSDPAIGRGREGHGWGTPDASCDGRQYG